MARLLTRVALGVLVAVGVLLTLYLRDTPRAPPGAAEFVRAEGRGLVRNGMPFRFKSIGFSNDYSLELGQHGFSLATPTHHSERDFAHLAELGFNSVRFAFNGSWYRDDPRAFWRWLDRNVAWAKRHGILLTLDLHVPIGGSWLDQSDGPGDFRLWTEDRLRSQNIELWRRIAERYRDEPTIAGFDLLNEAVTSDATGDQWRALAADMARAIREVDSNHLLIVGALYGTEGVYEKLHTGSFFRIDDRNVLYDFHFYEPVAFTHQTADWLADPIPDGGSYPDPDRIEPTGRQQLLPEARIESHPLPPGDSGWMKYTSDWVEITDPRAVAALPTAVMRSGARGRVHIDDLEVFERDAASGAITRLRHAPLSEADIRDWWPWGSPGPETRPEAFARAGTGGVNDDFSLRIDAEVADGAILGWSSDALWVKVAPGNSYRISGSMSGVGVGYGAASPPGFIGLALDVYAHPAGRETGGFLPRGRDQLEAQFLALYAFGRVHRVPMSVMEFGTISTTFDAPGKGGARWIADMLDLFEAHGASFSLWNYHGPAMGLYRSGYSSAPARPNRALIELLEAHLGAPGA